MKNVELRMKNWGNAVKNQVLYITEAFALSEDFGSIITFDNPAVVFGRQREICM